MKYFVDLMLNIVSEALVLSDEFRRVSKQVLTEGDKGTAVAQWLRCCATNRKIAGSIPDGVTGIFH